MGCIYKGYGATGLILSSCLGMFFRIYICWRIYISKMYQFGLGTYIKHLSVRREVLLVYALTFVGLYSIRDRYQPLANLAIGACNYESTQVRPH